MKFNTALTSEDKAIMRRSRVIGRNGIQEDDTKDYSIMLKRTEHTEKYGERCAKFEIRFQEYVS